MTAVYLVRSADGRLCSCRADGHSGYAVKGTDIVCAAVTVLMRTALQVLSETDGVQVVSNTASRGVLSFSVKQIKFGEKINARLEYAGEFLEKGFSSLAHEYPANVILYKQSEA